MKTALSPQLDIPMLDLHPPAADFHGEFLDGLTADPKRLPCKYFYDEAGSRLFEEICELPEYYPTRTEARILRQCAAEVAEIVGPEACVVEPGSGSTRKVRLLLDHLRDVRAYIPVEISRSALESAALELRESHPQLKVLPVCADYTRYLRLPAGCKMEGAPTLIFFPGSTIGNFEPASARRFLARLAYMCGPSGFLLIGVDLRKDPRILERAYNDRASVTARFNKNILVRANRELGARFDLSAFAHRAIYNEMEGRIEMQLVSRRPQLVPMNGSRIGFAQDETITTEYSYKYTLDGFRELAHAAGYRPVRAWTDRRRLFSVHLLKFGHVF